MERVLLDTDIFSELLRAKNPSVVKNGAEYLRQFDRYTISAVTIVEVVRGFQKVGHVDKISELTDSLIDHEVLPLDEQDAIIAGSIYGSLQRIGQTIGRADPMIAGIAIHHDLLLVTGNARHFDRVVQLNLGLRVDDWRR